MYTSIHVSLPHNRYIPISLIAIDTCITIRDRETHFQAEFQQKIGIWKHIYSHLCLWFMPRPANLWESKTVFCDPKNCIFPPKTVFYNKMHILRWKKVFLRARAHHEREVLSAGVQGPKGPGSTRVLGALWCNLSLIFEHYSKTLTKFS